MSEEHVSDGYDDHVRMGCVRVRAGEVFVLIADSHFEHLYVEEGAVVVANGWHFFAVTMDLLGSLRMYPEHGAAPDPGPSP